MSKSLAALVAGAVFGLGLSLSGMTDPEVVLGFLTVASGWNPALLLVMASAVTVTGIGYLITGRRAAPLFEAQFQLPEHLNIDGRLLLGATVFGVGWGLAGYCPGPALVGAFTLDPRALVFLPGFIVGMLAFEGLPKPAPPQIE
jgi:uncharacterized membrane protein YedE/YeeE